MELLDHPNQIHNNGIKILEGPSEYFIICVILQVINLYIYSKKKFYNLREHK